MTKTTRTTDSFIKQVQASIPVPVRWHNGSQIASRLLTPSENQKVFDALGKRQKSLASTVAQVWFALPKHSSVWVKKYVGVICFVKDSCLRSYFIRVLNISGPTKHSANPIDYWLMVETAKGIQKQAANSVYEFLFIFKENGVLWEQEVYRQFKYKAALDTFHTFEGDVCNVGLNFCDFEEADHFKNCVTDRILFFKRMRQKMKRLKEVRNRGITDESTIPYIISNVKVINKTDKFRMNMNKRKKREIVAESQKSKAGCHDSEYQEAQHEKNSQVEDFESKLIQFSSDEDSYSQSTPNSSDRARSVPSKTMNTSLIKGEFPNKSLKSTAQHPNYTSEEDIVVRRSHGTLSSKHSLIPLLKNSSHSMPRKRSRGTLTNFHYDSSARVKKLNEKQKEYHSAIIKSLFLANKEKVNTKSEGDSLVGSCEMDRADVSAQSCIIPACATTLGIGLDEASDQDSEFTEAVASLGDVSDDNDVALHSPPGNVSPGNETFWKTSPNGEKDNRTLFTAKMISEETDSEQGSKKKADQAFSSTCSINGCNDQVAVKNPTESLFQRENSVTKPEKRNSSIISFGCSKQNKRTRSISNSKRPASLCGSQTFSAKDAYSICSFPSLPSIEKLELSPSMQREGLIEQLSFDKQTEEQCVASLSSKLVGILANDSENTTERAAKASALLGWPETAKNNEADKEREIQKFSSTVAKVLDLRTELMKSIIVGKKLKKVFTDDIEFHKHPQNMSNNEVVTSLLAKALEERNKSLRDSSDEEDDEDQQDNEWEECNETWDH